MRADALPVRAAGSVLPKAASSEADYSARMWAYVKQTMLLFFYSSAF